MEHHNEFSSANGVQECLIREVLRAADVIASLPDKVFTSAEAGSGSIGAHFRHDLDFIHALLDGIATGTVDYNARERGTPVENCRESAREAYLFAARALRTLRPAALAQDVLVRSEVKPDSFHGSTVLREMEFVYTHMVHHHAIVTERLRALGISFDADLGYSLSTLEYLRENQKLAA